MSKRDFRGALNDPARAPDDLLIPFGRRSYFAFNVDPATFTAALIAPLNGVEITDDDPPPPDEPACAPTDMTWYFDVPGETIPVTTRGVLIDVVVGSACAEVGDTVTEIPVAARGILIDVIVGTACAEGVAAGHRPVCTVVSPLPYNDPDVRIPATTHLVVRVTDEDAEPGLGGGLERFVPILVFPDSQTILGNQMIHNGDTFTSMFAGSSRTPIEKGYEYDLIWYLGYWPSRPKILPFAYDLTGREALGFP